MAIRSFREMETVRLLWAALLAVLVLALVLEARSGAAGAAAPPSPEELCAPVAGTPSYDDCVAAARQALETGTVTTVVGETTAAPAPSDGLALSEENLREQRQVLWIIVGVVLVVLFVVVALSWRRSMKQMRQMFSPQALALMEQLIPPEVRAERPDVRVGDGLTEKERQLLRGQRNLIIFLLLVPAVVFVVLQLWQPSVDTSVTIGEVARYAPLVLAIPALWWTRRRVRRAMEAGDDRWLVLGLRAESAPDVIILPRMGGGLRATARGDTALSGRRYGRDVRIEMGTGSLRTGVRVPGVDQHGPQAEPGPGSASLWSSNDWLVLDRTGVTVVGPLGMETMLRDLQRVEQVADSLAVPQP